MKKSILTLALISIAFTACKENKKDKVEVKEAVEVKQEVEKEGNVNITTSTISWKGTKPGGGHDGTVNLSTGTLTLEEGAIKGGEFVIDMNSIKCSDIPEGEDNQKLVGHLKNDDFFSVEKFPTAKFVITSTEKDGDKLNITGNLTLKDVTKSITIPGTLSEGTDGNVTLKSEPFKIDRTDFGVTYKSKKIDAALKDKFIDDLMEFTISIDAKK